MKQHLCGVLALLWLWSCIEAEGFYGDRALKVELVRLAIQGGEWLQLQQGENGSLGDGHESAQAFLAQRLLGFTIPDAATAHLKSELRKHRNDPIPVARLAHYVHGVLATCNNPREFYIYNRNLVSRLEMGLARFPIFKPPRFATHFEYSLVVLALCNSGHAVRERFTRVLEKKLNALRKKGDNEARNPFSSDTTAMAITALSCVYKHQAMSKDQRRDLHTAIKHGTDHLLKQQKDDGSFGNEITTALVVQALLAANQTTKTWHCARTMKSIIKQKEHWFKRNVMSTVHILPALVGALPADIHTLECPTKGPKPPAEKIKVCVKLVLPHGKTPPPPVNMVVAKGTSAHDLLKEAAKRHHCYKFRTNESSYGHMVSEICGIENNKEKRHYWMVYSNNTTLATHGVDDFYPKDGSCVIFKYQKPSGSNPSTIVD